ncbi:hypothetical protein [Bacillus cereus]|uniref:Uncharacterized protein n=1 Tax=Bacillus cereus TaxID=1396 RepID=A0A9X7LX32_BACCE|nr:hypothetical protein [Bacillus cereus]QDZ74538.1 hypothetical protein D0437_16235 [Bacillus cereus]
MDKSISHDSTRLLRKIDQKMRRIEFVFRNTSRFLIAEEKFEVHQLLLEVSQLLLTLQRNSKMTPLAKELSLQLQNLQEQYNYSFCRGEVTGFLSE